MINGKAIFSFLENRLNEDDILDRFKIELSLLTPEIINQAIVSQENIYEFLKEKIDDSHERAAKDFEKKKKLEEVSWFIENVIASFCEKGNQIILKSADRLRGGLLFYEKIVSLIDDKIKNVTEGISKVEAVFTASTKSFGNFMPTANRPSDILWAIWIANCHFLTLKKCFLLKVK